jgi:LacI family transcriptional regulator
MAKSILFVTIAVQQEEIEDYMSITTKEIAAICHVSRGTVYRALNNKPGISDKTRKMILDKAKELGYIPHKLAGSLARGKTDTVGIIVFDLRNEHFVELVHSIENFFSEYDITTYICLSEKDPNKERKLLLTLAARRVDGILMVSVNKGSEFLHFLKNLNVPVIGISNRVEGIPYVGGNNVQAVKNAMDYIASQGIRHQYFICPPIRYANEQNIGAQQERADAYLSYMKQHNEISGKLIIEQDYWEQIKRIISGNKASAAFLCSSDHYALRIYKKAREEGYYLPKDFSLMGFDGTAILDYLPQRINTIRYPADLIGRKAAEMLWSIQNGNQMDEYLFECPILLGETVLQKNR